MTYLVVLFPQPPRRPLLAPGRYGLVHVVPARPVHIHCIRAPWQMSANLRQLSISVICCCCCAVIASKLSFLLDELIMTKMFLHYQLAHISVFCSNSTTINSTICVSRENGWRRAVLTKCSDSRVDTERAGDTVKSLTPHLHYTLYHLSVFISSHNEKS